LPLRLDCLPNPRYLAPTPQIHARHWVNSTSLSMAGKKVCCAECGLLALRDAQTRDFVEAEREFREAGALPMRDGRATRFSTPICFGMSPAMPEMPDDLTSRPDADTLALIT